MKYLFTIPLFVSFAGAAQTGILGAAVPTITGAYNRTIAIDNSNTGTTLTNAQLKIQLTGSNFTFSHAKSDGSDIRIYDGTSSLPLYIESYDNVGQAATIWFKGSVGTSKSFTLNYGDATLAAVSSYSNVFQKHTADSTYLGLYHLDDATGTTATDATGTNNATVNGTWTTDSKFSTGTQVSLNGTSNYISVPGVLSTFPASGSVSLTVTPSVSYPISTDTRLFLKQMTASFADFIDCYIQGTTGKLVVRYSKSNSVTSFTTGTSLSWASGTPYRVSVAWDGLFSYIYLNGTLYGKFAFKPTQHPLGGNTSPLVFGALYDGSTYSQFFSGKVDEIVITDNCIYTDGALADAENRVLIPAKIIDKLSPQKGTLKVSTGTYATDAQLLAEPCVYAESDGSVKLYYSGFNTSIVPAVHYATATTATGTYTKQGAKLGVGLVGNRQMNRGYVIKSGSTYYYYGTDNTNVYLYSSSDGAAWTDLGLLFNSALVGGTTHPVGNISVWPVLVGGLYHLWIETYNGTTWEIHHMTSTALTSGWAYDQKCTSLTIESGKAVGGPDVWYDTKWHMIYHYVGDLSVTGTATSSVLPTHILYANSTDGVTWSNFQDVVTLPDLPFGANTDQTADPQSFESGGSTYLFCAYNKNVPTYDGLISLWKFNGTRAQLVAGGLTYTISTEQ
jgi:hypothetical protein